LTERYSKDEKTPLGSRDEFNSPPSVQIPPPAPVFGPLIPEFYVPTVVVSVLFIVFVTDLVVVAVVVIPVVRV